MKTLFPELEPFNHFFLKADRVHSIYVEQCGNPQGVPVIFLHGGPCSGCKPDHRRFFDPEYYHIILFDQRGCGRSLPFGELAHNTLSDLISDMEHIRQHLTLENWILFGGSWGVTLALAYAQKHVKRVQAMILRGSFLARLQDMDWFLDQHGVALIYPEMWKHLNDSIPIEHRTDDLVTDLSTVLWGDDELAIRRVVKAWQAWGGQVALGHVYQSDDRHLTEHDIKQVQMEVHYAKHHYFLVENELLTHCEKLRHLPITIIHGRNDLVCPIEAAWQLHQVLPQANYIILPNSGHIAQGNEMIDALVSATESLKAF
ncbi:MAG: prolyl aminopeptidase [Methylococcales bacterium]|nr:prolyl aminopeptidase [Methylococcales bacterium]MDD5754466.1 prolyl aminopeptidase [Methylococcales bacterium]